MGFLSNMFNPKNLKYNLPPGLGMLYGGTQGGGGQQPQTAMSMFPGYMSGFPYGGQNPGTGPVPDFMHNSYGYTFPGTDTLFRLLQNPGQTDSKLFNMSLTDNARNTQYQQDSAKANLARSGFGGSGLGAALQAAIGQAGANQAGKLTADEARRKEDLTREDLGMLNSFFIQPNLQQYGINKGVAVSQQQSSDQKKAATMAGIASLIGIIAAAACHTADELYGKGSPEAWYSRTYMALEAEPETIQKYGVEGGSVRLAAAIKEDPELRKEVKGIFDGFVERGRALWERR